MAGSSVGQVTSGVSGGLGGTVPLDLSISGMRDESNRDTSREQDLSGKNLWRKPEFLRERVSRGSRTGDNGANTRALQQSGGSGVHQTTSNTDRVIGGRAPGNLSQGGKEDTPNRGAIRTERTPGRYPQGAPAPPKVKIDKRRDNKASAGGKGEEEHQIHKEEPSADVRNRAPLR